MSAHRLLLAAALLLTPALHAQTVPELGADLIIPPTRPTFPVSDWKSAPGREPVSTTLDGVELRGFRYPGADPKAPPVLFFNGNGMTILRTDRFYRALADLGPTVIAYDYRGYGFTAGQAHLATYREDGLALYDQLVKTTPGGKVVVYGASMGTTIAAYIASRRSVAGLVLGMPIASVEEEFPVYARQMGAPPEMISSVKLSAEAKDVFGEAAELKPYTGPLLVLGGTADTLVPMNQGREIVDACGSTHKRMVEVPGAGHNDVIVSSQGLTAVSTFVKTLH